MATTRNDLEGRYTHEANEACVHEIVFLIPVYNTKADILKNTVIDLYNKIHKCTSIVVVDDGSYEEETKNALKELENLEDIVIIRSSENRGKIRALLFGLEYIRENFREARCVFILDDDVLVRLPYYLENEGNLCNVIVSECKYLNELVPVVTFPARSQSLSSYIEKLQDMEHLISTHLSRLYLQEALHSKIGTECGILNSSSFVEGVWVNGSGSLWLIDELHKILESHSGEHDGDDIEMALILRRYKKMIKFSDKLILYPKLKSSICEYIKQRIHWSRGALRLLLTYPNEVLFHYTYLLYVLAPILLYLDIVDSLIENIAGTFQLKLVFDFLGIAILTILMVSFLRTIKFFKDVDRGKNVEEQLVKKLALYAKIFIQYRKIMIFQYLVPLTLYTVLLYRERIFNTMHSAVQLLKPCIDASLYLTFLFASMCFTYRLLSKYQYKLCYVYDDGVCKPSRITLSKNVIAYSLYILVYILVIMPTGYLYFMIEKAILQLKVFRVVPGIKVLYSKIRSLSKVLC